jgi:hypothetical protein
MAFRDFSFPEVQQALGLTLAESNLFDGVPALDLSTEFSDRMRAGVDLALAINTEKARSEFIIAPGYQEGPSPSPDRSGLVVEPNHLGLLRSEETVYDSRNKTDRLRRLEEGRPSFKPRRRWPRNTIATIRN